MAAKDASPPPPPPPPPPGMERTPSAVPHVEPQPAAPVVAPVEAAPAVAPPAPIGAPVADSPAAEPAAAPPAPPPPLGDARPDPYAPPTPGYSAAGYGYQAPANPPASPYAQPGQPGYGAQPVYGAQPAYAQQAYGQQPYAYVAPPPKGISITSMVLGLAGFFLGFVPAIAAVITGHIASRSQPYAKAFWLTGIITGYVVIAGWILILIFYIFLFSVYGSA